LKISSPNDVQKKIQDAAKLRIFLDYDGTLAEFAETPDEIYPNPHLIELLERLRNHPRLHVAIISGRRLSHVQALVPVPGIILAGTYGIEFIDPNGKRIERVDFTVIRPTLAHLKPLWLELIRPHQDIYMEDKGWTLALHAKSVDQATAEETIRLARQVLDQISIPADLFRILGGHKFLEIAPKLANKGLAVGYFISRYPLEGALPIYIGDDDKDEEAFEVILKNGGIPIKVGSQTSESKAQLHLDSPKSVRQFLASLL
jgi:trehalose 6-phosphate phosphatase